MKRLYAEQSSCRASPGAILLNLAWAVPKATAQTEKLQTEHESTDGRLQPASAAGLASEVVWGEVRRLPWASWWRPLQSYRAADSDSLEGWSEACGKLPASPSPKGSSGCHRQKAERPGGGGEEETCRLLVFWHIYISVSGYLMYIHHSGLWRCNKEAITCIKNEQLLTRLLFSLFIPPQSAVNICYTPNRITYHDHLSLIFLSIIFKSVNINFLDILGQRGL